MAGCFDFGTPNDVTDAQEKMRQNRGVPNPTELPPGLGDDLPTPTTQPQTMTQLNPDAVMDLRAGFLKGAVVRHVISALVMNEPGVLAHVAGMFSAAGLISIRWWWGERRIRSCRG